MTLPISQDATITMSVHDFRQIERQFEELRKQVEDAKANQSTVTVVGRGTDKLTDALRTAIPIIGFAVGNINPESNRGWPHHQLDALAKLIQEFWPNDAEIQTIAITWEQFAREAEECDDFRQRRFAIAADIVAEDDNEDDEESPQGPSDTDSSLTPST